MYFDRGALQARVMVSDAELMFWLPLLLDLHPCMENDYTPKTINHTQSLPGGTRYLIRTDERVPFPSYCTTVRGTSIILMRISKDSASADRCPCTDDHHPVDPLGFRFQI